MRIGIDIGGSHIGVGLVQEDKILDIIEKNFTNEDFLNIEKILIENIVGFIENILDRNNLTLEKIDFIGIASPGTISNGTIIKAGNLNLYNLDILSELKKYYNIPIKIRNDGKCAALAEKMYGAMKDYDDCLFMNIGTGIGGAVFMNGKLLEPKKFSGFEIGHMIVEKNGRKCTCGKQGCIETYASIKALKDNITNALGISNEISGKYLREELLQNNNPIVKEKINDFLEYLKIGVSNLIDIFEPEVICFGGSFSHYKDTELWNEFIKKMNDENVTFNNSVPNIVTAKLQNNAGIIGAVIDDL